MSSYADARDVCCLWYRVDANDDDPMSFFYYFGLAVQKATGSRRSLPRYSPERVATLLAFSCTYFRDAFARLSAPSLIVLDNFQEASAAGPLSVAMRAAFDELPAGLNTVVLSRGGLPAALSRLRTDQRIVELAWRDLRLTESETREVAALRLGEISAKEAGRLHCQTDGWAAALALLLDTQTAGEAATQLDLEQSREALYDYLDGELLRGVDDATRAILIELALLTEITPRAAEAVAVAGNPRALQTLGAWVRRGFLVSSRPGTPVTYQMHPLLRAFLLHEVGGERGQRAVEAEACQR